MARLFGTDGVRGVAGEELTSQLAVALGRAAVQRIGSRILIGRDSRLSGPMLEEALCKGIAQEGGMAVVTGIIPTPAIAYLTCSGNFDAGIVISASHNPPEYNGIKFFSSEGFKLPDAVEDEMQEIVESIIDQPCDAKANPVVMEDAAKRYIDHAVSSLKKEAISFEGMHIALDCGYGAACETTPVALRALGAKVTAINNNPDGAKINVNCGSTHLEPLAELIKECGADIGLAHDGDADRMLAVAPNGVVIDGDHMLAVCAADMKRRGVLAQNLVVGTVMANMGLKKALKELDIDFLDTKVGDRYVLEEMRQRGGVIGGEQSGHIIFLEYNTTGDGLFTALQLLAVLVRNGKRAQHCLEAITKYPQALVNVKVIDKSLYPKNAAIKAVEEVALKELGENGRLLVRESGTEPLVRVMIEAETQEQADRLTNAIADVVKAEIGA